MLAPPPGLRDDHIAAGLRAGWSADPEGLAYAPVGFGSHHWVTDDLFVTVDEAAGAGELAAALATARALREEGCLGFVIAPVPSIGGSLLEPLADGWVMHVYDRLAPLGDPAFGPHDDPDVVGLVRQIHDATPIAAPHANRETFAISDRDDLEAALDRLDEPWDRGPYGERARHLLRANADDVRTFLAIHDRLAADVDTDGWVVTHGEPHRGNIFETDRGWAIVDWDTALLAPPERDLWDLPGDEGDPTLRTLYRLRWDLSEVAVYTSGFLAEHRGDPNDERSWEGFVTYVDLRTRWPSLR